jgi:hypothetical protein
MKILARIFGFSLDIVCIGALYVGLSEGNQNLINVGLFLVYLSVAGSLIVSMTKEFPKTSSWRLVSSIAIDAMVIAVLVWYGYTVLAIIATLALIMFVGRHIKETEACEV